MFVDNSDGRSADRRSCITILIILPYFIDPPYQGYGVFLLARSSNDRRKPQYICTTSDRTKVDGPMIGDKTMFGLF